ncbi:MAG: glucose-1-phosphate adenylyltransferase [Gemmataceae bacterium]|nr:glucose-1-phosphate adenylyltransferase [Gemmataceae bacterium]
MDRTLSILLAGGVGTRLHPLTADRAKPAVPFAGKYRIIDFTLTNCLHSGLRRVLVLTQYKSHSLQKHLRDGWSIFNPECGEYITPIPPQMRTGDTWYVGTANAIYQNVFLLERSGAETAIILSGDHIYRMDYAEMLKFHHEKKAALTIACMKTTLDDARSFGVMGINDADHVLEFQEKPESPKAMPDDPKSALVSMGIYVFNMDLLCRELKNDHERADSQHDFGKDIIPHLIQEGNVYAYRFGETRGRVTPDRYWRDVGTIDAYYDANMDLLKPKPAMDLYQDDWPIRTYHGQNPPARMVAGDSGADGILVNSILGAGSVIAGATVRRSILSAKVRVEEAAEVLDSILFDRTVVGRKAKLRRCIIDKEVKIPPGETIGYDLSKDAKRFTVSEQGVVVVPKGYKFCQETMPSEPAEAAMPEPRLTKRA